MEERTNEGGAADTDPPTTADPFLGDALPDSLEAYYGCSTTNKDTFGVAAIKAPGSGSVVYVYADTNKGSHENASASAYCVRDCQIGQNGHTAEHGATHHDENNSEKLTFQDGAGGWNNWEACYKYRQTANDPWIWYAAGTGGKSYTSVQAVMNDICSKTRWRYCTAGWQSLGTCEDPGPYPEATW